MASAFGHAAAAVAFSQAGITKPMTWRLLLAGVVLSILPDADSIGFLFGVPYGSFWGHRGFSHSIVFALLIAVLTQQLCFNKHKTRTEAYRIILFLFFSCVSHTVLDAMTTGGLGVAFFSPFNNERYFFPFRPIKVSPISVKAFFNGQGWKVIRSEVIWIGIPVLAILVVSGLVRMVLYLRRRGNQS